MSISASLGQPSPQPPHPDLFGVLADLAESIDGELRLDLLHQMLYATDASLYAMKPLGVAYPRHGEDIAAIIAAAKHVGFSIIPRTAGTSLAGQCVGPGLILDVSRHMNEILELNVEERWVRVQPGVILDELNRYLAPHGLMFGPDTSTSSRCMIGGMIGNNSCGSHSILHGNTMAHTLEVEAILSDASRVHFGAVDEMTLREKCKLDSLEGALYRELDRIVAANRDEILARFPSPRVTRRNMGYPLDDLANSERHTAGATPWNLARFLCGTEGTLAVTVEAKLNLVPTPRCIRIITPHFDDLDEALRATVIAVGHDPAAVELIDRRTFDATRDNIEQRRNRDWIIGDPSAALIVEFYRDTPEELTAACKALTQDLKDAGLGYAFPVLPDSEQGKVWALRKAGLGLLMGTPGDVKPITFVEDTAVAVEDLPAYIQRFSEILKRHDTQCVYYAHASVGELHLRPELNPKDLGDIEKMKSIAAEVADLVRDFRGSISGEHGDGRVRSPFIKRMFGEEIYGLFQEVKSLFDPSNTFNPGNIVAPVGLPQAGIDEFLRYPPGRPSPTIPTYFDFPEDKGLLRAVERCNGAGACRKLVGSGGTMCPSYMATLDEKHSTRGRANVFRMLLLGSERPEQAWGSHELYEALALCLGCKACKSECPASVDMARLKSEFLQHYHDIHGLPMRSQFFGDPILGYQLARRFSGLSNAFVKTSLGKRALKKFLGVHPSRDLPSFAPRTLRQQIAKRAPSSPNAGLYGEVVLYIDMFTDYNEPHIGIAAIEILEHAGYRVLTPEHPYSGRTQLSKGLMRKACELANASAKALAPFARRGISIVGIEPSAILSLSDEHPDLVSAENKEDAQFVAGKAQLLSTFLAGRAADDACALRFKSSPRKVRLHAHCHQKALIGDADMLAMLRLVPGWEVSAIPSGCCGMAGSFGYEEEHYEISMSVGELVLFPDLRAEKAETLIAAPGTSCRHQIKDGTGRIARHPIELLHSALDRSANS